MKTIRLSAANCLTTEQADLLVGGTPADDWYDLLVEEDTTVYKPDGSLLCVVRKNVLPVETIEPAFRSLRTLRAKAPNRRTATQGGTSVPLQPLRKDGKLSNTVQLPRHLAPISNVVGYFERTHRFPYCRQTRFSMQRPERFQAALPFIRACARVFAANVPDRYAAQMDYIKQTHPDYIIHGTPFTTITVNLNYPTAVHKDVGDLDVGFSCLSVIRAGRYSGGVLCFPQFRIGVDLHTSDMIMMDAHEWHANTPLKGVKGTYERLTLVMYYRTKMIHCGSQGEELERVKNKPRGSGTLWADRDTMSDGKLTNIGSESEE